MSMHAGHAPGWGAHLEREPARRKPRARSTALACRVRARARRYSGSVFSAASVCGDGVNQLRSCRCRGTAEPLRALAHAQQASNHTAHLARPHQADHAWVVERVLRRCGVHAVGCCGADTRQRRSQGWKQWRANQPATSTRAYVSRSSASAIFGEASGASPGRGGRDGGGRRRCRRHADKDLSSAGTRLLPAAALHLWGVSGPYDRHRG